MPIIQKLRESATNETILHKIQSTSMVSPFLVSAEVCLQSVRPHRNQKFILPESKHANVIHLCIIAW